MIRLNKSNGKSRQEMQCSEAELLAATSHLEEMHNELMPQMLTAVADYREELVELDRSEDAGLMSSEISRRKLLLSSVVGAGVLTLAACGSKKKTPTTTTTAAASGTATNLAIASLAASLENLAVSTYQAGLTAANQGQFGAVPPAVATFITTAMSQHQDHAKAWNAVLTGANKTAVTGVDQTVKTNVVDPAFGKVKDVPALANLALTLENSAAATYLKGISLLSGSNAIATAASIQPVEMQHAAILNFVLGNYPSPDSFAKTDGARTTSDTIG